MLLSATFRFYRTENIKNISFAQDLLLKEAVEITKDVIFLEKSFIFSGDLLERIGTMGATPGDLSEPGLVIRFIKK